MTQILTRDVYLVPMQALQDHEDAKAALEDAENYLNLVYAASAPSTEALQLRNDARLKVAESFRVVMSYRQSVREHGKWRVV